MIVRINFKRSNNKEVYREIRLISRTLIHGEFKFGFRTFIIVIKII